MVETITPVVHGRRRLQYWSAVASHVVGATAAAAGLGAVLGGAGALVGAPWGRAGIAVVGVVALLYALREGAGLPIPLPDRHAQVPEWWRAFYSPRVASFLYGVGLGVGLLTFLSFGTFVAVAAAALVSGDPLLGAGLCAPFGLARGVSVTVACRAQTEEAVSGVVGHLERWAGTKVPRRLNAAALTVIALLAGLHVV